MKNTTEKLERAQTVSEEIALEMFEAGYVTEDQLENFLLFAKGKTADRIVTFGDDVREAARKAYLEAIERVEL